jgi:cyclase
MSTPTPYLVEVAPQCYAYIQPDGTWWINNTGCVVGDDGMTLIDTCSTEQRTIDMLGAVRSLSDAPLRHVVNTHHHGDHTHGNFLTAPAAIIGHTECRTIMMATGIDHYAMAFEQPVWGALEFVAPSVTFSGRLDVWAGDLRIELHDMDGAAHTTNDVVAWVPDRGVLYTGDLVFHQGTPFVLMGSVTGSLRSLDVLRAFGATTVVPGHGPVCGPEVFDEIEAYLRFVLDLATTARRDGLPPLVAAESVWSDLGPFAGLTDPERLVGNLHRAMAELDGLAEGGRIDIRAAIGDMLRLNGGGVLRCCA